MTNRVTSEARNFVSQIVGPIFLLCTLFLAGHARAIPNYDLIFVSVFGLYFCAKWRFKGLLLASGLLALSSLSKHLIYTDQHIWQGGFELSIAISLLISTYFFHESANYTEGISAQNRAQGQTIEFLEEDLFKTKSLAAEEALQAADKASQLHAQLDEALAESSSYQILNDVLRKSTARAVEEKERLDSQILQSDRKVGQLLLEMDVLQKELARMGNESAVITQNGQLFAELNIARTKEAQTHLVNETLVRMHRSENARVKELEARKEELDRQVQALRQEVENSALFIAELKSTSDRLSSSTQVEQMAQKERAALLEAELARTQNLYFGASEQLAQLQPHAEQLESAKIALQKEVEEKKTELFSASSELAELQIQNSQLNENRAVLETELAQLKEQIFAAPLAIAPEQEALYIEQITSLQTQLAQLESKAITAEAMKSQLETVQMRLKQFAELELLYRQLKGNFQAKTKVLHETRVQLFHVDTELATLKQQIAEEQLEGEPLIPELSAEIEEMERENLALALENSMLNELIAQLMGSAHESHVHIHDAVNEEFKQHNFAEVGLVKKKVKRQKAFADQHDLFDSLADESV